VIKAEVFDIEKGKNGVPGELKGSFPIESKEFGTIEKNTNSGIYGIINSDVSELSKDAVPVASKNAIEKGKAHILCDVDGNGKQSYEIEIQKIYKNSAEENKNMVIKITDRKLLEKAGGIVQGMSGSPIVQNGKLVGAVTHV